MIVIECTDRSLYLFYMSAGLEQGTQGKDVVFNRIQQRKEKSTMKRIALISIIAGVMVLTTACGGAAPATTLAPTQPAATKAPAQPTATAVPASTETAPATGNQVDITLTDNKIASSMTAFQVGVPYTFVIT